MAGVTGVHSVKYFVLHSYLLARHAVHAHPRPRTFPSSTLRHRRPMPAKRHLRWILDQSITISWLI